MTVVTGHACCFQGRHKGLKKGHGPPWADNTTTQPRFWPHFLTDIFVLYPSDMPGRMKNAKDIIQIEIFRPNLT